MPRLGQTKPPADERLSDRIAIGLLTRVFPPAVVDAAVAEAGRGEVRSRLLPARVTVYYVLAMCLFSGQGYEEVMRLLVGGLEWLGRWRRVWSVPSTAAIAKARARLGAGPLRALFVSVVHPLAAESTQGSWYRGLRVVAMDGTTLDLPDTAENDAHFGRPGSSRGEGRSAFPQVRLVGLAECGTHAVFAAALGPYASSEKTLAAGVLPELQRGMLLLADRGFTGYELWRAAAGTGAQLLWRAGVTFTLPPLELLPDGSYLSRLLPGKGTRPRKAGAGPVTVRVIEYTIDDGRAPQDERYRLITTLLNPGEAPAAELAALYAQRWEFENALDEIKIHQRAASLVLRSRYPDGVEQEVWGFLLVHWAIRDLMHSAALDGEIDPDRVSFTRPSGSPGAPSQSRPHFPPDRLASAIARGVTELQRRLTKRRLRASPRVVKRKMSNYPLKRAGHRSWPRPAKPPGEAITIADPATANRPSWSRRPDLRARRKISRSFPGLLPLVWYWRHGRNRRGAGSQVRGDLPASG